MLCYKDRTYCASPNCVGKCGREKLTEEVWEAADNIGLPVAYGYFCDEQTCMICGSNTISLKYMEIAEDIWDWVTCNDGVIGRM